MNNAEKKELEDLIASWTGTETKTRAAFLHLKTHLESKENAALTFKARPGVSYSLRGAYPGHNRQLFVMIDVIDDDPDNRWLSVCFYGDMIADPDEMGDMIPGGLLGEDGYCFDIEEAGDELIAYVETRIDEAYQSAVTAS
ncbi:MAG: hypothetical protein SWH61_14785 [Thermodesulfobacteriota bacterium]|nr:hypothetical protein [Thermodesulfobacteriota bacterium]